MFEIWANVDKLYVEKLSKYYLHGSKLTSNVDEIRRKMTSSICLVGWITLY